MKLKRFHFADVAEIQEAVTDELMRVQKEEFSTAFHELYNRAKTCIYAYDAYFEFKKSYVSSSYVFDLKKKFSPKTFRPHCVCSDNKILMKFEQEAIIKSTLHVKRS